MRYCLTGPFGNYCNWIAPQREVRSYAIGLIHRGQLATRVRAIFYAPDCAVETLDVTPLKSNESHFLFACRRLPVVSLNGTLTKIEVLRGRKLEVRAKYVPYWASGFLGVDEGFLTTIWIGAPGALGADNQFTLSIPDFSRDASIVRADRPGALQLWARDAITGALVALLIPIGNASVSMREHPGDLNIEHSYPEENVFVPCPVSGPRVHDHIGFALRSDPPSGCRGF